MNEQEPQREEETAAAHEEEAHKRAAEFEEAWQPKLWAKIIALVVVVGYGIALVVANSEKVKISFLFASIHVSKIWLILLCFVIGLITGVLVSQMHRHRRAERARLEEQAAQASKPQASD
jgi:uncharacterized integral membrane protein